jgi:hypothetical protein
MGVAPTEAMANAPHFKDAEERDIARGGKATAIWMMSLALFVVAGGIALAAGLRHVVSPPTRPGASSGSTTSGATQPPSP